MFEELAVLGLEVSDLFGEVGHAIALAGDGCPTFVFEGFIAALDLIDRFERLWRAYVLVHDAALKVPLADYSPVGVGLVQTVLDDQTIWVGLGVVGLLAGELTRWVSLCHLKEVLVFLLGRSVVLKRVP